MCLVPDHKHVFFSFECICSQISSNVYMSSRPTVQRKTFEGETFTNFAVLWRLFWRHGVLWCGKSKKCTSFLCKNRIFHQFAKVFSLESFLLYGMSFLGQVRPDPIFGVSLSEPHTSVTALQNACVCLLLACLLAWLWPYTVNLNWTNKYVYFKLAHVHATAFQ